MSQRRNVTPWFPVAVDPVHEGIYEVEYRQSRFLFRREWRDGVWAIPGAVLLPARLRSAEPRSGFGCTELLEPNYEESIVTPLEWMMAGDTGVSSKTILHVMEGTPPPAWVDVPHDPADFGRCHRLLEAFPAYRARLGEVAAMYPAWTGLVREWDALTEMYCVARNTGAERAEGLYDRMQSLIDEGRRADGWTENAPGCWSRGERRSVQIGDGVRIGF